MLTILGISTMKKDLNGQVASFKDALLICLLLCADCFITAMVMAIFGIQL